MDAPISAKAALLQALLAGPGYGLDLIDRVKHRSQGALVLGQGSVYPALRDLEVQGFVWSFEGPPLAIRGGRPRRYYKLSARGAKEATRQRVAVLKLFGGGA